MLHTIRIEHAELLFLSPWHVSPLFAGPMLMLLGKLKSCLPFFHQNGWIPHRISSMKTSILETSFDYGNGQIDTVIFHNFGSNLDDCLPRVFLAWAFDCCVICNGSNFSSSWFRRAANMLTSTRWLPQCGELEHLQQTTTWLSLWNQISDTLLDQKGKVLVRRHPTTSTIQIIMW
jgi:hypothetical protein